MAETNRELSLNKLIVLYMLDKINMSLTNTKISEFILDNGYTNYFSLQKFLNQMVETDLLKTSSSSHNTTLYNITDRGKTTLDFFENRIPDSTKEEIKNYLEKNRYEIRSTLEISADYIPEKDDEYLVICKAKEKNKIIMELKLTVHDKEYATKICDKWQKLNHQIYKDLLNELIN